MLLCGLREVSFSASVPFSSFFRVVNDDIANNKPTKSAGMDLSEGSD